MSLLHEVEEFLRTTDSWDIDWISGYYNILSKDFIREFRHHLTQYCEDDEMAHIWHTFGNKFAEEIFGREKFIKFRNRVEFMNDFLVP